MRVKWFEVGLAGLAVVLAAGIGLALQQETPGAWGAVTMLLVVGRIALR